MKILKNKWVKGVFKGLLALLSVLILLFLFRYPIMKGLGNYLIYENSLEKADVVFVLSGSPVDRGNEAVAVYNNNFSRKIFCTGSIVPHSFQVLGLGYTEGDLLKKQITKMGIPDSVIVLINQGTSTVEEKEAILSYCLLNEIESCIVITSKFHTKRVKKVFKLDFENEDIQIMIHGAPSSQYNEKKWWENEYGLLAVNNEYVKLVYYWIKGY